MTCPHTIFCLRRNLALPLVPLLRACPRLLQRRWSVLRCKAATIGRPLRGGASLPRRSPHRRCFRLCLHPAAVRVPPLGFQQLSTHKQRLPLARCRCRTTPGNRYATALQSSRRVALTGSSVGGVHAQQRRVPGPGRPGQRSRSEQAGQVGRT
jgi:hypothetical protein